DVAVGEGFGQDVQAAGGGDFAALSAQGVLVDGDDVLVGQDAQGLAGGVGDVGAGDQGGGHLGPEGELGLLLGGAHAVADLEHVRVVPVSGSGVGGQAHVAVEDGEHAGVGGVDVAGGAPGVADVRAPGPYVLLAPAAQGEQDGAAGGREGVAHGAVAGLRGDAGVVAVVVLEVVHAPGGEAVGVGALVAEAAGVAGAGLCAGVLVDAQFQAEGVHVGGGAGDAVGELGRVRHQLPGGVAVLQKPAVVDVDVLVAGGLHPVVVHGQGGGLDQRLGDVTAVRVPVVEPHLRSQRQAIAQCLRRGRCADSQQRGARSRQDQREQGHAGTSASGRGKASS